MRQELDDKLVNDFPTIFKNRHANMMSTCMCWGFECGDGWFNIIYEACKQIDNYIKNKRGYRTRYLLHKRAIERYKKYNDDKYLRYYINYMLGKYSQEFKEKYFENDFNKLKENCMNGSEYNSSWPEEKYVYKVVAIQVKEKYGTLRFYVYGGDEYTNGIIDMAEAMSAVTCEICGDKGVERNERGWYSTMCDKCFNKTQSGDK